MGSTLDSARFVRMRRTYTVNETFGTLERVEHRTFIFMQRYYRGLPC